MAKLDKLKAMMMGKAMMTGTTPPMKGKGNMPMKKGTAKGKKVGKPC